LRPDLFAYTDFAQRLGLRPLAEHHGHKLTPAAEAFGRFLLMAFFARRSN
jgi:hypothetical protein